MGKAKAVKASVGAGVGGAPKRKEGPAMSKTSLKAKDECYQKTSKAVNDAFFDAADAVKEKRNATAMKWTKRTQKSRLDAEKFMEDSHAKATEMAQLLAGHEKELQLVTKKLETGRKVLDKIENRSKALKEHASKTAKEAGKEFAEVASSVG